MIKPELATYKYTKKVGDVSAQSRVECRFSGNEIGEVLAARAEAYPAFCSCKEGATDYGGKVLFFIVYVDTEGRVCRAERGVEFAHRAAASEADETCLCALDLKIDDVSYHREGANIVAAAVVRAESEIYKETGITYLSGGENLVLQKEDRPVTRATFSVFDGEEDDLFETEFFTDILLHKETACVKSATLEQGVAKIEGEIALNACVLKADGTLTSYERLIPISAEMPAPYFCDEAWKKEEDGEKADGACGIEPTLCAKIYLKPATLNVETSEENDKCFVKAHLEYAVHAVQYTPERVSFCQDAFSTENEVELRRERVACRRLKRVKTYVKKATGIAALSAPIDYTTTFHAVALPHADAAVKASAEGTFELEGAATARVIFSDKEGFHAAEMTLPFLFSEGDAEIKTDGVLDAETSAVACGISLKQKKEGEAEAEVVLKFTVNFYETDEIDFVAEAAEGEAYGEGTCGFSIFLPRGGDGLWETAKSLRKSPEEVARSNPELSFPLKDKERILVYNRKK